MPFFLIPLLAAAGHGIAGALGVGAAGAAAGGAGAAGAGAAVGAARSVALAKTLGKAALVANGMRHQQPEEPFQPYEPPPPPPDAAHYISSDWMHQRVPSYAGGTRFHPGGLAMVGERGPELLNLPRGSEVYTGGAPYGGDTPGYGPPDYNQPYDAYADQENQIPRPHYYAPSPTPARGFLENISQGLGSQPFDSSQIMQHLGGFIVGDEGNAGALIGDALGSFANYKLGQAGTALQGRRDAAKGTADSQNKAEEDLFHSRLLRIRAAAAASARGTPADVVELPNGAGRVSSRSRLGQIVLGRGAGIDLAPRPARPPAVASGSLAGERPQVNYKRAHDALRMAYWWNQSRGVPQTFANYSNSQLPPAIEAQAEKDPSVVAGKLKDSISWYTNRLRKARNAGQLADILGDLHDDDEAVQNDSELHRSYDVAKARIAR